MKAEPYGWSPQTDIKDQGPPVCTDLKPEKAPILLPPNHPALIKATGKGQVRVQWHKVPGATGYNVYYGLTPKNYIYTFPDVPDSDNVTISHLANRAYYFAVQAKKGCAAGSFSNEVVGRPNGGGYSLAAAGFAPVVRGAAVKKTFIPAEQQEDVRGADDYNNYAEPTAPVASDTGLEVTQPDTTVTIPTTPVTQPTPKPSFWKKMLRFFGL